ncbi:MAG TPA: hypothetical protein VHC19_02450 [Pirellulales bacterium]|nr:hypothetical protein [Pirellulales bacterium]
MRLFKSTIVLDYHLVSGFEKLRQKLLLPKYADRLDKPLAFWALPADRHLPLALVGRTLQELLSTPFEDIYSTPGIGPKKISTLLKLLQRAAQPLPPGALTSTVEDEPPEEELPAKRERAANQALDLSNVSEALWITWRDAVRDYGLGGEPLGRFAPSLQRLPRVLWMTPLQTYLELSLADIRRLKTHGEKRVRAVLEVFGNLHQIIANLSAHSSLAVRIVPRNIASVESWIASSLVKPAAPTTDEIKHKMFSPLVEQLRVDTGDSVAALTEARLDQQNFNVQQTARRAGVTRARVYELLGEVPTVIGVRWPEGPLLLATLRNHLAAHHAGEQQLELLDAAGAVLYGQRNGSVNGSPEPAGTPG